MYCISKFVLIVMVICLLKHITARHRDTFDRGDDCRIFEQMDSDVECPRHEQEFHFTCQRWYCRRDIDQSCIAITNDEHVRCRRGLECCFEDAYHQFCHGCIGSKCSNKTCGRDSPQALPKRASNKLISELLPVATGQRPRQQLSKVQKPISILYIVNEADNSLEQDERSFSSYS